MGCRNDELADLGKDFDYMAGRLQNLLDAGMTGKLDEEVDLREVVADIAEDAGFEAHEKRCTIEVDLNGPVVARGSHELLYRAIENVVRNAVRYSPKGGTVTISARSVDGRLRVTVADSGPGVFDGDLDAIFDPFFRSGPGQSVAGDGLGLAISRRVVEAHSGGVSAANRADGGLLVTLELPVAGSGKVTPDSAPARASARSAA